MTSLQNSHIERRASKTGLDAALGARDPGVGASPGLHLDGSLNAFQGKPILLMDQPRTKIRLS